MKHVSDLLAGVADPKARAALSRIQQGIEARGAQAVQATAKPKSAEIIQLPLWPEPARGVPNSALRGALFAAIQGKDRQYMDGAMLAITKDMQIRFTGMQLDQSDMDVWELALHLARQHPLGTRCEFTMHGFLKALGRSAGKKDHERMKGVFRRLAGAVMEITHNRMTYGGTLLEFYRDEDTGRCVLEINPKLKKLYDAGWTAIDWQQRQQLNRKPLALWLHGFYASHAEPYPVKVETLHRLSGSRNKDVWGFKRDLKKALDQLQAIGAITGYEISGDLVTIDRTPSGSQRKHLRKARPRKK